MHEFDKSYWETHWSRVAAGQKRRLPVNPYLPAETAQLTATTALDAGCGTGTESLWLAEHGWQVTGADISARALAVAAGRAAAADLVATTEWVQADLAAWEPDRRWDLVVTHYVHPNIDQFSFYRRISSWVSPGGTILIVGHLHEHGQPEAATATLAGITDLFDTSEWRLGASYANTRIVRPDDRAIPLRDVIVRAHRRERSL